MKLVTPENLPKPVSNFQPSILRRLPVLLFCPSQTTSSQRRTSDPRRSKSLAASPIPLYLSYTCASVFYKLRTFIPNCVRLLSAQNLSCSRLTWTLKVFSIIPVLHTLNILSYHLLQCNGMWSFAYDFLCWYSLEWVADIWLKCPDYSLRLYVICWCRFSHQPIISVYKRWRMIDSEAAFLLYQKLLWIRNLFHYIIFVKCDPFLRYFYILIITWKFTTIPCFSVIFFPAFSFFTSFFCLSLFLFVSLCFWFALFISLFNLFLQVCVYLFSLSIFLLLKMILGICDPLSPQLGPYKRFASMSNPTDL